MKTHAVRSSGSTPMTMVALLTITVAGCSSPPSDGIEAAREAYDEAVAVEAQEYAPEELAMAEDAQTALQDELALQADRFRLVRSYDRAEELAAEAVTTAQTARAEATTGRELAREEATRSIAEATQALTEVKTMLETAPRGKGSVADLAALAADLEGASAALTEVEAQMAAEEYLGAMTQAAAVKESVGRVRTAIEQATQATTTRRTSP